MCNAVKQLEEDWYSQKYLLDDDLDHQNTP